jgi:ABC-type nitrate/sulfonate/bicarbonate transport system permease component
VSASTPHATAGIPALLGRGIARYWGAIALVLAWQLWVTVQDYNSIVLPTPLGVLSDVVVHADAYLPHVAATATSALAGLGIGVLLGALFAGACWFTPMLDGLLTPAIVVLRSIPIVATIPIVARLCGYDSSTVLVITVMLVFFPVFVFCASGLRDYSAASADLFRTLGCNTRWRQFVLLAVPAAVPHLATALRVAAPACVLAALVAEFLMGTEGLGYVMQRARSEMMMERSWGAALVATVLSVLLYNLAVHVEILIRRRWEA